MPPLEPSSHLPLDLRGSESGEVSNAELNRRKDSVSRRGSASGPPSFQIEDRPHEIFLEVAES